MKGIKFNIRGELAHFRNPYTISFFETLLAPPKTTVSGMIGAAMGLDEPQTIELNDKIKIGVKIKKIEGFLRELTTFYNLKKTGKDSVPVATPILREVLVRPEYSIYVASEDEELVRKIFHALQEPMHPLYLGISDYIAQHDSIEEINFEETEADSFDCVIPFFPETKYIPEELKLENGILYIAPKVYRTVLRYEATRRGRKPIDFIDLMMFYGYSVKLSKPLKAYKTEVGELVYLI